MAEIEHKIFISFVHEDVHVANAVQALCTRELMLEGSVFLSSDQRVVLAGDVWLHKITAALTGASVVILLLSQRAVRRPWVNFEAGGAWLLQKTMIPCCYGNMSKERLPHPYGALQAVNLPKDAHYLVQSIHTHLGLATPSPQPPFMKDLTLKINPPGDERVARLEKLIDPYNQLREALAVFQDERELLVGYPARNPVRG